MGSALAADTIRLDDGRTIENVQVITEGLKEVVYREGRNDRTVPSETVVTVTYEKAPPELGEAEAYLLQEDPERAAGTLDAFVQGALDRPQSVREFKWAPAQAAWRAVEVRLWAADLEGAATAAARVIHRFGDTRYAPLAYLAKASAELDAGQADQALKTLGELSALVTSRSLAKRWGLEARLAMARADGKSDPASKRGEYEKVMAEAGDFPTLRAAARLRIAESYLAESADGSSGAQDLRAKARAGFETLLASDGVPRAVVAASHAGRGECLFRMGAEADDKAQLLEAALAFLRVTTLYRDQGVTVAKSLFYAMRAFDLLSDARRKAEMKRELLGLYPGTTWAAEAKKY